MATIDDRDARMARLQEMGVAARLGGCPNIGHEAVFGKIAAHCPNADGVGERTLSLPVYPTMTNDEVEKVCDAVEIVCA